MELDNKKMAENWVAHQKAEVSRIEAAIAELQHELASETYKLAVAERQVAGSA